MKKIEAIIRPLRLEAVKTALAESGVTGITVSDVRGSGRPGASRTAAFRGEEFIIQLPPKIKLEIVVPETHVDAVVAVLLDQARTGEEGDGKIFVMDAIGAVRVRTGETGDSIL